MTKTTLRTATPDDIERALRAHEEQCPACGVYFKRARHWQVFCSDVCRKRFHGTAFAIERLEAEHKLEVKALNDRIAGLEQQFKELERGL